MTTSKLMTETNPEWTPNQDQSFCIMYGIVQSLKHQPPLSNMKLRSIGFTSSQPRKEHQHLHLLSLHGNVLHDHKAGEPGSSGLNGGSLSQFSHVRAWWSVCTTQCLSRGYTLNACMPSFMARHSFLTLAFRCSLARNLRLYKATGCSWPTESINLWKVAGAPWSPKCITVNWNNP